jgi:hypothetical protein
MWSPSFVPKCSDWPAHVDVVGDFTRPTASTSKPTFLPDPQLSEFLESCGEDKPIYIGFGSMVIPDAAHLINVIKVSPSLLSLSPISALRRKRQEPQGTR